MEKNNKSVGLRPPSSRHRSGSQQRYGEVSHNQQRLGEMTGSANLSISSRYEYPSDRPFINDQHYKRDANKPVSQYPENNRQSVMLALKSLQEKIRSLEQNRVNAENHLKSLTEETSRYRELLHDQDVTSRCQSINTSSHLHNYSILKDSKELKSQLEEAEARSQLLEKQLDYMRRLVDTSEREKSEALRRARELEILDQQENSYQVRTQLDKVAELERDQMRLTALQSLAQNKIRELEQKLQEEQHHRKLMQQRSAELETEAQTERILGQAKRPAPKKKKPATSEKVSSKKKTSKESNQMHFADASRDHYHLRLSQIPFITGKSTTPSYSVPANVQTVLALMKSHNPRLCPASPRISASRQEGSTFSDCPVSMPSEDLADLLLQLQDEFSQMSFEHQELSRQLQDTTEHQMREDLDRELDSLVARMEMKGDQIAKLRRHQELLSEKKKKKKKKARRNVQGPKSVMATVPVNGKVEVTTTIRSKRSVKCEPTGGTLLYTCPESSMQAKTFLNDLKKIQTTLRKDDLQWDN